MASDPAELQQEVRREAQSALAPLAGSRAQSLQRLQIGLFGLAAMLLLVGLANIIMDRARMADDADAMAEVAGADLGWFFDEVYRSSNAFDYGVQDLKSVRDADYRVPREIGGMRVENVIISMAAALRCNGSQELSTDITNHYIDVLQFVGDEDSAYKLCERARNVAEAIR